MASVQLRNVTKAWGDVVVSKDINLDIHDGEFVVFVGLVTAGIEGLLNTFLYRSPALKSARTRLQGKVLCVKLKGFSTP
ncbi:hypothetical protein MJM28_29370, partial [Salmonella enterica subsp. enterica serovar Montevideo]|nr:hypothetical protein [Salmonella enterica subsp. enterica serovar Montevideo]